MEIILVQKYIRYVFELQIQLRIFLSHRSLRSQFFSIALGNHADTLTCSSPQSLHTPRICRAQNNIVSDGCPKDPPGTWKTEDFRSFSILKMRIRSHSRGIDRRDPPTLLQPFLPFGRHAKSVLPAPVFLLAYFPHRL